MKFIFSYLKPLRAKITLGLIIKITGTFADLGLPWVLSYIIDKVIPKGELSGILLWGAVMAGLAVMARGFNIIANRNASAVAKDCVERIRHDLFKKIFSLSGKQTDAFGVPSLISRMTSDSYNIHRMIGMMQRLGIRAPLILIGGVIITFTLEPVLALVLVAMLPFLAFIVYHVSRRGIPLYADTQKVADRLVKVMRENISGIRVIKALSKTEYERKRFAGVNEGLKESEWKAAKTMAVSGPCMNLLLNLGLTLIVAAGAFRVNSGAAERGAIVAFLTYFTMILNAVLSINRIFIVFSKASASAERMAEVANATVEMQVIAGLTESDTDALIEFRDVSFSYTAAVSETEEVSGERLTVTEKKVSEKKTSAKAENLSERTKTVNKETKECLKNISFSIKKGESLGIIGATGSGKTTIVNLMMRFYDTSEGNIYIDKKDIRSYELSELRRRFGAVFQNDIIFSDTVRENIDFGRSLADEQIEAAAEDADALGFILGKEGGFDYKAAIRGADFSGGQKQRLLISRALAAKPEILVLDDSSSALDYKTDAMLRKAINENYSDATTILIAQRVSSVMNMTNILVLDEGRMTGYGTHEELLENCDIYREIYELQMGYGI